jgi:hypothetical protein
MITPADLKLAREYDIELSDNVTGAGGLTLRNAMYCGPANFGTMRFDADDGNTYWLLPKEIKSVRGKNDAA